MAENIPNSEEFIKEIILESDIAKPQQDEKRIAKIISQTRRNVGTRDFILLIFVRFWIVLAEFTCKMIARKAKDIDTNSSKKKVKP